MKGRKQTEEHKAKKKPPLQLGKKRSEQTKKLMSSRRREEWRNGKRKPGWKQTIETRKKISEAFKGEKSNGWKGGITPINLKLRQTIEYRLWREAVFARDRWTCQDCGDNTGGNLNAHHIKMFSTNPELRTAINNGITLCKKCHNKRHKQKK